MTGRMLKRVPVTLLTLLALGAALKEDRGAGALQRAERLYRAGDHAGALKAVPRGGDGGSQRGAFIRGAASYRIGDYRGAADAFAAAAGSRELAAKARFNRGNALYQLALQQRENAALAAELLRQARQCYREAQVAPEERGDAGHNLTLVEARLAALAAGRKAESASPRPSRPPTEPASAAPPRPAPPGAGDADGKATDAQGHRGGEVAGEGRDSTGPVRKAMAPDEAARFLSEARRRELPHGALRLKAGGGRSASVAKPW